MDRNTIWERFSNKMAVPVQEPKEEKTREDRLEDAVTLLTTLVAEREETKAVGNVHSAITLHDGGGIFGGMGLERDVITAHIRPKGLAAKLPLLSSIDADPRFASLTGFSGEIGARATTSCADAPTGYMKGCNLTALFGLERQDTETIEMDKVMLRWNRGDFRDLVLRGKLLGLSGFTPSSMNEQDVLNIITKAEMVSAAIRAERSLVRQLWQGNILLSEFPGLDRQIATGQVDADTNTACSALDSDVKDFGYDDVCGTGRDIVEYLSMMMWYLEYNAEHMGLDPVQYAIVMNPNLWFELSACWPCRYLSNRCQSASGTQIAVINDENNTTLRDSMRQGLVIEINGIAYPVVIDHGIFEHDSTNNANLELGEFASSIYAVPLTIQDGFPVTYREYLDYRQAAGDVRLLNDRHDFWTDDGIYSWAIDNNRWCYQLSLKTEQRVVLRTPQLAGKIQYVKYTPLQHLRSPFADSDYFQDGGVSIRTDGTKYAVWAASGTTGHP